MVPSRLRKAIADTLGLSQVREELCKVRRMQQDLLALEGVVLKHCMAPDGLPYPPMELMYLVAGAPSPEWFIEGGQKASASMGGVLARNGYNMAQFRRMLDFGCGCGRVLRQWQGLSGVERHGTDYNARLVEWCARNLPFARVAVNGLNPPLAYPTEHFDFVYALSVFTHLPEDTQHAWMAELRRILRPQGLLVITLHGDYYLSTLTTAEMAEFKSGNVVVRHVQDAGTNLCASYHPRSYVGRSLAKGFDIVEFVPEGAAGNPTQDLYLLKKKG
jgi:SAM-dependent methyltransferase